MAECIHGFEATFCFDCKPRPPYDGPHWDAAFLSDCCVCAEPVTPGQRIRWNTDGTEVQHSSHK